MRKSTLLALFVIATLAFGVAILREAFPRATPVAVRPQTTSGPATTPSPLPTPSPSPSPSPTREPEPEPKEKRKPRVEGIVVQVVNATHTSALASEVAAHLAEHGYTVEPPDGAPHVEKTTVYYQPGHKIDASYLQKEQFPGAAVAPASKTMSKDADITVVLGLDYAP